jgi:hypothetical protein
MEQINFLLTIVSLVASSLSIVLAVGAIWLSWKFSDQSDKALREILASSKSSEFHSKEISGRFIEIIGDRLKSGMLDITREEFGRLLKNDTNSQHSLETPKEIEQAKNNMLFQIQSIFDGAFSKYNHKDMSASFNSNISALQSVKTGNSSPNLDEVELRLFLNKIENLQMKNNFLGVTFLKKRVFVNNERDVNMLQYCIDNSILLTYKVRNPLYEDRPVLAVRINKAHPFATKFTK